MGPNEGTSMSGAWGSPLLTGLMQQSRFLPEVRLRKIHRTIRYAIYAMMFGKKVDASKLHLGTQQ